MISRNGATSAEEAVLAALDRIRRFNSNIHAVVLEFEGQALERARELDRAADRGPLHGVALTVKESFAYKGTPSSWGVPEYAGALSTHTAPAVAQLEAAGAVVVGKTNVAMMLTDWQSSNPVYGTTNNPWDVTRTAGGSSGGSAAAVACGMGDLSLGSDIGGSIRVPAHFCGVYGHKPTIGLVSLDGHTPGAWDGSVCVGTELPVAGPLARSAEQLMRAMEALVQPELRMAAVPRKKLNEFRVGFVLDDDTAPVTSDVRAVYEDLLKALGRAGVLLHEGWPEGIDPDEQFATYRYLLDAILGATLLTDEEREEQRVRLARDPGDAYAAAVAGPHWQWMRRMMLRAAAQSAWRRYFDSFDVFLMPAALTAAFEHDASARDLHTLGYTGRTLRRAGEERPYDMLLYWPCFATVAGLPATIAPVGTTREGLPVGVQIVGPMWCDTTTIEFARLLGEVAGGFVDPPITGAGGRLDRA